VNRENPVPSFTMGTLDSIFRQRVRRWEDVPGSGMKGAIELALTGRNSGLFELLANRFTSSADVPQPAFIAPRQSDIRDFVGAHAQAIGWAAIPALPDTTAAARRVPVVGPGEDGVVAPRKLHQANVYQGFYPLHYPLYLAYVGKSSAVAVGFGAFIASAPGQKIILNAGLVPATMPVRLVQVNTN
jgi:phosphate transport system substrate-binding protein